MAPDTETATPLTKAAFLLYCLFHDNRRSAMDKFVPDEIRKLIENIEKKKVEKNLNRKNARLAEHARQRRIEILRYERKLELFDACERIDVWIEKFHESVGPGFWKLMGPHANLTLFIAKFWRGEPAPAGDVTCSARLRFGGPESHYTESLVYEEFHKGNSSSKQVLLGIHMFWQRLHPEFILQCDAHLSGPDPWKYIRQCLEQIEGRPYPLPPAP
jgi:hypothetical protein